MFHFTTTHTTSSGVLCTTLIVLLPKNRAWKWIYRLTLWRNWFDHLHEILAPTEVKCKNAWALCGPRFSMSQTHKAKLIPPIISWGILFQWSCPEFGPLFTPTPGHTQEVMSRTCMNASTNVLHLRNTQMHTLCISIHTDCMRLILATGLLRGTARKEKQARSSALDLELKWLGENSNFFQLHA